MSKPDPKPCVNNETEPFLEVAVPAVEIAAPLVGDNNYKLTEHTFLVDSACSSHMGGSDAGMFDVKEETCSVKIGDGKTLTSTKVGSKKVTVVQQDGSMLDIVLKPYKYVPGLWCSLFALLVPLYHGWQISNKGPVLTIRKGVTSITFDRIFKTQDGFLGGVDMMPREDEQANISLQAHKAQDINFVHKLFGHCTKDTITNTAKYYDFPLKTRTPLEPCDMCKIANAVQVDCPKDTATRATKPGERFF